MNGFNELFDDLNNKQISFYIFEKENVNCLDKVTKDGIHIIVNIIADFATKVMLRKYILKTSKTFGMICRLKMIGIALLMKRL